MVLSWADLGILGKGARGEAGARANGGRYCDVGIFRLLLFEWSFSGATPIIDKTATRIKHNPGYKVK